MKANIVTHKPALAPWLVLLYLAVAFLGEVIVARAAKADDALPPVPEQSCPRASVAEFFAHGGDAFEALAPDEIVNVLAAITVIGYRPAPSDAAFAGTVGEQVRIVFAFKGCIVGAATTDAASFAAMTGRAGGAAP